MLALAITSGVTLVPAGSIGAVIAVVALGIGLATLLTRHCGIAQTTLVSAWWWTLAALVGWSAVEMLAALIPPLIAQQWLPPLRLLAVSLSLCPVVALIGAKRPQHVAWNFVVLSLWAIVALPAAEVFFLRRGQPLELGDARGWFLWILVLLGPVNLVPTRYALASLTAAAGQIIALSAHLVPLRSPLTPHPELVGLALCAGSLAAAWLASHRQRPATNPYDRLWFDFRDSFGLLWGLRVQQRVNAAAQQYGWDLELTWRGFRRSADDAPLSAIDPAIEPILRTTLKGLLRRFVSNEWIAERMGMPLD